MSKPKLTANLAMAALHAAGASGGADFHTLRQEQVATLLEWADVVAYRQPKNANGSRARYFHAYCKRVIARSRMA